MDDDAPPSAEAVQDPALDTTPLPATHPTKLLADARIMYQNSRPSFITTSSIPEGTEREVFIARNGQRPPLPIRANLVARRWGQLTNSGLYWTLDLNGERHIVVSFPNKGCVSGAKWVYCPWTGVGENFEELPLAFTCINGEYKIHHSLKAESAAAAKRATSKDDRLDTAADNVTPLPKDHPIEYLDEAAALYVDSRPPFVVQKSKFLRKRVRLAAEDGRFSATAAEAEIVYRVWDSLDSFPTLDLNGKRFIIMGNAGGPRGGYQYHLWLGSKAGRMNKAIAYGGQLAKVMKERSDLSEHLPETGEDSCSTSPTDNDELQDSDVGTTETRKYCYDKFIDAFNPATTLPAAPLQFQKRRSTSSSKSLEQEERSYRKSRLSKRARSSISHEDFRSGKDKRPAKVPKRTPYRSDRVLDDSPRLSNAPLNTPAPTPSVNDRPAPAIETPDLQTQLHAFLPTLTLYKKTHTTLRVTRDSNIIGFVPLRLMTCMTMSTLFSSVVAASGYRVSEEPIECLMVVFDWKDEDDVYKTIYIDKGTQGSFEIFLEIIDEASCWKDEGGKCGIVVEIVRA